MKPFFRSAVLALLSFAPLPPCDGNSAAPRDDARSKLLGQVDTAWRSAAPEPLLAPATRIPAPPAVSPLGRKIDAIILPTVSFVGTELSGVIQVLAALSEEFDPAASAPRGVNLVLIDPAMNDPAVTLTLRNVSLRRVLDLVTSAIDYEYELQQDVIVVRPLGSHPALEMRFFAISRATVLRLTGRSHEPPPVVPAPPAPSAPPASSEADGRAIRNFLQSAGVPFDAVPDATLAFDGSQLIVAQTPRNLERIAHILARYQQLRQIEIEAKFMEVQEGALEELGVQWRVNTRDAAQNARVRGVYSNANGATRSLNEAFSFQGQNRTLDITVPGGATVTEDPDGNETPVVTPGVNVSLPVAPPSMPGGVSLGSPSAALAQLSTALGEFDVNAIVRALQQRSGTELLSAPRLTVLSGNAATITVAQEMRYPQSYGQIQSQVGTGSVTGGGSAGVSITSGTPQDFATRNVGVELKVTATVEEDDRSISLDLNPKVTEFEGFVEYGSPSVAISGGTTVTVPPGFYQPIFAVREVTTRVTLWDGATLIMGGLTREDVKKVHDKVPLLGSLPLLGRLFRSEGESTQKRNLLIFVTARLVSGDGTPVREAQVTGDR